AGGENLGPAILGVAQHCGYKSTGLVIWRAGVDLGPRAGLLRGATRKDLCAADKHAWINTECPTNQAQNDNHANAETTTAAGYAQAAAARRARLAVILDVATGAKIIPTHISLRFRTLAEMPVTMSTSQSNRSPARSLSSRILALYQRRRM